MASKVNVHDAKTGLSALLARVERGEEITIARNGKPVADLVAHRPESPHLGGRGVWAGRVDTTGFDQADEMIARDFGLSDSES